MFPIPPDVTQVKLFLRLAGFYRPFIKDYGRIAAPLTHLLKKDVPWRWDASNVGLGAVLMQEYKGNLRPIGFASRVLTSAEKNYSVTDREMLAIVWALKYFRDIILGYKVMVHTDHMPLTSLNGNDPYGRRARYQDILGEFDVTFVYIQGRANVAADTSRAPIESSQSLRRDGAADFPPSFSLPSSAIVNSASQVPPLEPLIKDEVYAAQRADERYGQIIDALSEGTAVPKFKGLPVSCDTLSGFTTAVPSKAAVHVTKAFHDVICCRHGCPQYSSSDNGTEFVNQVLASLTQQLNVTQLVDDSKYDWNVLLPTVQSAINSTYHSSLGDSPHFLLTGQDKRLPYELLEMKPRPLYADNYADYLVSRQQRAFQQAKVFLTRSRDRIIEYQHKIARAKTIGVGSLVFRKAHVHGTIRPKLSPLFVGPYRVLAVKNNKAECKSVADGSVQWFHFDILKLTDQYYQCQES
ncbi:uncharacterized protein LOC125026795 [Penaeus chinensis]|uniref:uncharacterized protein LOC125026795 n=1 Tax=Penaeus chinensis TaxID=139456 RepID=UPI001FB58D9D|nr:uncharacterized protein LOC125026795 [Penaeus chinensis]